MGDSTDRDQELVRRVLGGSTEDAKRLFSTLVPVIQVRVARILWRHRGAKHPARQDVMDLTQDVVAALLADDWRVLRSWDNGRGLSLKNFVGMVAERHTISALRKRLKGFDDAPIDLAVESVPPDSFEERAITSRDLLEKLSTRLHAALSPLGLEVFHRLYIEELSIAEIQETCGLSAAAIYQWRARLRAIAKELLVELEERDGGDTSSSFRQGAL